MQNYVNCSVLQNLYAFFCEMRNVKLCHPSLLFKAGAVKTMGANFAFGQADGVNESLQSAEAE